MQSIKLPVISALLGMVSQRIPELIIQEQKIHLPWSVAYVD